MSTRSTSRCRPTDPKDSASARSVTYRLERCGDHVPADDEVLWEWLTTLDDDSRMDLLAHCVSYGISEHGLAIRMRQAERLARATGLDMMAVGDQAEVTRRSPLSYPMTGMMRTWRKTAKP